MLAGYMEIIDGQAAAARFSPLREVFGVPNGVQDLAWRELKLAR